MVRGKKLFFGILFLLVLAIFATGFKVYEKSQENKIPPDIRSQITSFQPYYLPKKYDLPKDFELDKESVRYEFGTLLFSLTSPEGQTINISQQSVPKEFSAEGGSFVGKDSVDTKNGKATISYVDGRTSAFLITNDQKTLIILNSNQAVENDVMRGILSVIEPA